MKAISYFLLFLVLVGAVLGWLYWGPWNMNPNLVWGQDVFVASPKQIVPRSEFDVIAYEDNTCGKCREFVFDKVPKVLGQNVGYYVRNMDDINPQAATEAEKSFAEVYEEALIAKRSNPNGLFLIPESASSSIRPVPLFTAHYKGYLVAAVQMSGEADPNWIQFKDWLQKAPAGLPEVMDPGHSASAEETAGLPYVWQFRRKGPLTIGSRPEAGTPPKYYISIYGLLWPDEWPTVKLNPLEYFGWRPVPVFNWSNVSGAGCTKWIPFTYQGVQGVVCEVWKDIPTLAPRIQVPFRDPSEPGFRGYLLLPSNSNQTIFVRGPLPEDSNQVFWRLVEFEKGLLWVPLMRVTIMTPEGPLTNVAVPQWDLEPVGAAEEMFESLPTQQAAITPSPVPTETEATGPPPPQPVAAPSPTPKPLLGEVKSGLLVRKVAQPGEETLPEAERENWVFFYKKMYTADSEAQMENVENRVISGSFRAIYQEVIGTRFFKVISLTWPDGQGENTDLAGSYGLVENIGSDPLQASQ